MPKRTKKREAEKSEPEILKGWQQIAAFLGEPTSVVRRWASDGMPVRRQGRFVNTTPEELNAWLGKESGRPVHVATENTDLTAELKRGLRSFVARRSRALRRPDGRKRSSSNEKADDPCNEMARRHSSRGQLHCLCFCHVQSKRLQPSTESRGVSEIYSGSVRRAL